MLKSLFDGREYTALMDFVKSDLPVIVIQAMFPDKGRSTLYMGFPSLTDASPDVAFMRYIEQKYIKIEPYQACFTFTKNEIGGCLAVLDKKIQTKTYIGLCDKITFIPTNLIYEWNILCHAHEWYRNLKSMLEEYSTKQVTDMK